MCSKNTWSVLLTGGDYDGKAATNIMEIELRIAGWLSGVNSQEAQPRLDIPMKKY